MTSRPSRPPGESDVDLGEPVEREGHETLLPSVQRSVLSGKSMVAGDIVVEHTDVRDLPLRGDIDDSWDGRNRGAKPNDLIGGRYIVEGQLGRGGMGRVLRVRHSALGKPFALKIIKTRIASNPKIREMFYREARLASALTHDNICSIVDFGQDDQFGLFMVMELLDGQTVHAKLKQSGKLSPKIALAAIESCSFDKTGGGSVIKIRASPPATSVISARPFQDIAAATGASATPPE